MSGINRNGGRSASGCRSAGEDVLSRDARFSRDPYERGACLSPRTGMQDAPDNSGRPPLRPCPQHNGCGRNPRPEFGNPDCNSSCARVGEQSRSGNRRAGCGCGGDHEALIEELRAIEFALDEVILYLDAYPCDQAALDLYRHLLERRCPLVERYQAEIGPLTPLGNMSNTKWEWVSRPFPWDYDANV